MTVVLKDSNEAKNAMSELDQLRSEIAEDYPRYRDAYEHKFGNKSTLTDVQLFEMVCRSDDNMDDPDWADFMKSIEDGTSDTFAVEYNAKLAA